MNRLHIFLGKWEVVFIYNENYKADKSIAQSHQIVYRSYVDHFIVSPAKYSRT